MRPGRRPDPLLAPVLGFAAWSSANTILYLSGLSLRLAAPLIIGIAALAWLPTLRRKWHVTSIHFPPAALIAAMVLVALAPGLSGGEGFRIFQGNDQDQLNYLSFSSVYLRLSHDALAHAGDAERLANNAITGAQRMLAGRPAVSLSLGAFSVLTGLPVAEIAYPYLACLQALLGFALAFLLRGLTASSLRAVLGGAAFALGFFGQFAVDLDGWSQLAGMSVATAGLGLLLRFGFRAPLLAGLLLASLVFIYPEGLPLYGAAALPLLVRRLRASPARTGAGMAAMLVTAGLVLGPFAIRVPSYLLQQSGVTRDDEAGWARHFFGFLFGRDGGAFDTLTDHVNTLQLMSALARRGVDLAAGLLGLFPLSGGVIAANASLAVFICALIAAPFARSRGPRGQRLCLALAAGSVFCVVSLALGHPYITGKAWLMLSPVMMAVLLLPLLRPRRGSAWGAAAWLYLGLQLGFGLWRPIIAMAPGGIAYPPPYPSLPQAKEAVDWAVLARKTDFSGCRLIRLELQSPTFDRYLQTVLTDWGLKWYSSRPITTDYSNPKSVSLGLQQPPGAADCVASDTLPTAVDGAVRLIWLGRNLALEAFTTGTSSLLDVLRLPLTIPGLHGGETYQNAPLRWTDGHASFLLPVPFGNHGFMLDITLWPVRQPATRLQLRINGVEHFDGILPDGIWQGSFDIEATDAPLHIEIFSSSFQPYGDPRRLGVALQTLSVVPR